MAKLQSSNTLLDCKGLRALLAELPREAFVIGLLMHSVDVSQDEWLNPLAACLRKRGFVTVGIYTPRSLDKCDLGQAEFQALLEPGEVRMMERINVFIISDMDCLAARFPQTSKVLGCQHAFDWVYATSMPYQTHLAALLDGWMGPPLDKESKIKIESLWGKLVNRGASRRNGRFFHIIPTGYPRLATLARELRAMNAQPDSIVYAPIGMNFNREQGGNRLGTCGKRIIRTLLSSFPEMNIIFRPYKIDLESMETAEIRTAFANEKRFILDDSPGRLPAFSRSAVLVTDISHAAKTFAFAALRPAIYFQPWEKGKAISEWPGGHMARSFTSLVQTIREYLENMGHWENKIRSARDRLAGPIDNAFEDIAGWMRDFYEDRPKKEWLTIERSSQDMLSYEIGAIRGILKEEANAIPNLAAATFRFGNPESPLLAGFALHSGMIQFPKTYYYLNIPNAIYEMLDMKKPRAALYGETDPQIVRKLYSMALLGMIKAGDAEGRAMVEQLLASFNAAFPETVSCVKPDKPLEAPAKVLDFHGLEKLLHSLPKDKFVVGLFVDTLHGAQYEWLDALAASLCKKGYVAIAITTPKSADICRFKNIDYLAMVHGEYLKSMDRINVFVLSDIDCYGFQFPSSSKVLACVHSFYHAHSATNFPESIHFDAYVDGWMVPMRLSAETREITEKLWTGFLNPKHCFRKSPKFQIIPAGYPRLAAMSEELKKISIKPDSIVYAPLGMKYLLDHGGERLRKYGLRIIQTILDNFPEHNVIFRPMPGSDRDSSASREILAFYKDEPRFILDDDSAQLPSFSRAATVITDLSNIVKSFAFLTLRPGIFFRPWEENASDSPVRWDGGFHANTYAALIAAVRASIDSFPEESEIIRRNRDKLIMPIDNALAEIADWLPDFYAGKSRVEWLAINRSPDAPVQSDRGIIDKCERDLSYANLYASACAARFNNPHSPLLAAFALQQGLKYAPVNNPPFGLNIVAGNLLGVTVPQTSYEQMASKYARHLYEMALAEKIRRNDREGQAFVERLLREFNEICLKKGNI